MCLCVCVYKLLYFILVYFQNTILDLSHDLTTLSKNYTKWKIKA